MDLPEPNPLVELRDLSFGYGERLILDDLSLTVPRGKVTALMGASGGGKTTVLRLIGGQNRAQKGQPCLTARTWARWTRRAVCGAPSHGHAVPVRSPVHRPERV
jgi:phospholipid/cholesterol/gamma-HCH transport system ATP-binding protein